MRLPRYASLSITARLAAMITLILVSGAITVTLAALAYGWRAADETYDKLIAGAAFDIARSIAIVGEDVVVDLPVSSFELLALAPDDRVVYRIADLADAATITGYDAVPLPPRTSGEAVYYTATFGGEPVRLAAVRRVFVERAYVGEIVIIVGHTTRARTSLAWDIARNALGIVIAAGLAIVALTVFAVRSALSPLRQIEMALQDRDPADLSPLAVAAPPEVKTMVEAIDRFMARLSRRMGAMQNLIADAAHQLRTPMAALRAQADLAGEESDPDRLRAIATRIGRRTVSLSRLTDQLLNQAMIIHRADAEPQTQLDLRVVAMRVADEIDRDLEADVDSLRLVLPEDPIMLRGDELSLVEAVKNLVNNAFRYGKPPVVLSVEGGDSVTIAVIDHGPGIPEAEWADSGSRFARTAGSAPDSAGLGLSIVNAVAEAHGGKLALSRPQPREFRAALVLPGLAEA